MHPFIIMIMDLHMDMHMHMHTGGHTVHSVCPSYISILVSTVANIVLTSRTQNLYQSIFTLDEILDLHGCKYDCKSSPNTTSNQCKCDKAGVYYLPM